MNMPPSTMPGCGGPSGPLRGILGGTTLTARGAPAMAASTCAIC